MSCNTVFSQQFLRGHRWSPSTAPERFNKCISWVWWQGACSSTHIFNTTCARWKSASLNSVCAFGTILIALKEGGLRPIAVGQTLCRMVAKCAAHQILHTVGADIAPQQLWCGIPLGCKATVHVACLYLHNLPSDHQLLKLDFKNAFMCLCQDKNNVTCS